MSWHFFVGDNRSRSVCTFPNQLMDNGLERMSSKFRHIKMRIKLFIQFPNYASARIKEYRLYYTMWWENMSNAKKHFSLPPTREGGKKKDKNKVKTYYMLSPLIMYKPNTSCWTPSCRLEEVRSEVILSWGERPVFVCYVQLSAVSLAKRMSQGKNKMLKSVWGS